MLKNWTFLYSVTKNLLKFKSNHNPSIELFKSVITSLTSQTVLWNFCVCVCVCLWVFMSVGSHRGTQVAQSPLGWGDNLSRPLAMINLPPHQSGEKWKKRRKGRWKWQRRKMRKRWRETSKERDSGRGEGSGRTRCWCPGDSERVVSHSHLSLRVPHPDPFPGHVPQLTAREKSMSMAEAASRLWSSQKRPSLSGENTFIKALVERLNEQLSERCLTRPPKTFHSFVCLFFPDRGPPLIWMDPPYLEEQ